MSATVLCHGCGQQVAVPPGHTRPKMRCPECGVICDVPAAARAKAPEKQAEDEAADVLLPESEAEKPARSPARLAGPTRTRRGVLDCPKCGERVRPTSGQEPVCPQCGATLRAPTTFTRRPAAVPSPCDDEPQPLISGTSDDDGQPYTVPGDPEQTEPCPECNKPNPRGAVLCAHCGFDRETGRKVQRTYAKVDREWEAGWSFRVRFTIFLVVEALALVSGVLATIHEGGHFAAFVFSWVVGTALLAYLLGTYDRINLLRNKKGQVLLVKTWRICFIPQSSKPINWREHDGVVVGRSHELTVLDWVVIACLVPAGILPAILWWFLFIHPDQFHAALTKDHGFPETLLYRGRSEALAREIAQTVQEVTGLPYDPFS